MAEKNKGTSAGKERQNPGRAVSNEKAETSRRYADVYYMHQVGALINWTQLSEREIVIRGDGSVQLLLELISPEIIRFRYAVEAPFLEELGYAVVEGFPEKRLLWEINEAEDALEISTGKLLCRLLKKNLKVQILELEEESILLEEATPFVARSTIMNGLEMLKVDLKAPAGEAYLGLGDKSCSSNLRGHRLENWNTDSFAYNKHTDPLYRTIPFYYSLHRAKAYGIFMNSSWRSIFDFDSANRGVTSFQTEGGEMDYYFIYGPDLIEISRHYMDLTGKPELAPIWSLGFHQCRWSYFPEKRVLEIAKQFRELAIPCDAIYLDIDYMRGYRCFTWNHDHFPDPKRMIADLKRNGFHTVVMIDPGIRVDPDYAVYADGMEKGVFCRRASGELMTGPVWPPKCVFPDFTHPTVREWWGALYQKLYTEDGVSGFWNDMNEPSVFRVKGKTLPDHVLHHCDGYGGNHRKAHNIYGQQMTRATQEGLKKINPQKRPFVLTRASFSGGQRYAAVWTGDNIASWEHLRLANIQCRRLSISGFSFVGSDIGGFKGEPDGELLVRWLQLAVFHPVFRIHSMGNNFDGAAEAESEQVQLAERLNRLDQEPWSFGEPFTSQARKAIEFRYTLLPYIYTHIWKNAHLGDPVIKPLAFYDQNDPHTLDRELEFIFGDHLLVCPILRSKCKSTQVYLPQGEWFEFQQAKPHVGGQKIRVTCREDEIPVFVKAGAVIPIYPVQQYIGEKEIRSVGLRAYFGTEAHNWWYLDEGEGFAYRNGGFRLACFSTRANEKGFTIEQSVEGSFKGTAVDYQVKIFGLPFEVLSLKVDGSETAFSQLPYDGIVVEVPLDFEEIEVLF